ncbi:MAG: site-specific integrase [Bacteroidota bacterium]|nr:site-specific integrase [Bacteroidota bacterium]
MKNTIQLSYAEHRNAACIFLRFSKDAELISLIKKIANAKWSQTHSSWYVSNTGSILNALKQELEPLGVILTESDKPISINPAQKKNETILPELDADKEQKIIQFKQWMRSKRYSESTIGTYTDALRIFLRFYSEKPISEISNNDIIVFNNDYILAKKLSPSFQNQVVNAIKLFFKTVENKSIDMASVHRPKRDKLLPNVLSKEEVKLILSASANIKHRAMLSLIYSCGLRCGELLHLKPADIDSKRGLVVIRRAKGRKDRVVPLSIKVLDLLREYYKTAHPTIWLFEGQVKGNSYDERSLQNVLKQSLAKAGITKPATLHWLRHSYATHLLENGTDLRYIQELLGHSRSTTTEIYTHVSNKQLQRIISPFDTL